MVWVRLIWLNIETSSGLLNHYLTLKNVVPDNIVVKYTQTKKDKAENTCKIFQELG